MLSSIRQFHDAKRARVHAGDDKLSEWLTVDRGRRQGCVIAPLLFNIIFFTAGLHVALVVFNRSGDIIRAMFMSPERKKGSAVKEFTVVAWQKEGK